MTQQLFSSTTFAPPQPPRHALPVPQLREATFDDYAQIAGLERDNGLYSQPAEDWRSIWTGNPTWQSLRRDWPIGWVLEGANKQLVGAVMSVPSSYVYQGQRLLCANGRGWVVQPEYRGYSLWLMDEYLSQKHAEICIATTVGPLALETWSHFGRRIPVGDWCRAAYWITCYRGFLNQALRYKNVPLPELAAIGGAAAMKTRDIFKPRLPHAPSGVCIEETDHFDARFDLFWNELVHENPRKLLAVRNRATLSWHFAIPLRRRKLWIFTASRAGLLRAYCVLKQHSQSNGMKRMRIVDFQSVDRQADLLPGLLRAALRKCAREKIDLLENIGVGVPKMRAFDEHAPYQRQMETWPFFYRAADAEIHEALRSPEPWDPSVFDGDASFE